jgi:hypothetical protein
VDDDLERPGCGLPTLALVALGVLVAIGLITVVGWLFSLAWALIRLVLVLVVVAGLVAAWRFATDRR